MRPPAVEPRPQLLTYPDSLGGDLHALGALLDGPLTGLFRGVHILPPFPSSGDRGFAPITYHEIEPRFGTWADIGRISEHHDVLLDLMINHLSRQSPEFQDFQRHGRRSPSADLFITLDKVWPDGIPADGDVARIFLRKPGSPVLDRDDRGHWPAGTRLDLLRDRRLVRADRPRRHLRRHRIAHHRLVAGFREPWRPDGPPRCRRVCDQEAGTSCFMVEPEIYDFLEWVTVSPHRSAWSCCPRSTTCTRPTSASRRTASGRTTSCCRPCSFTRSPPATPTPRRASRRFSGPSVHDPR